MKTGKTTRVFSSRNENLALNLN